MKTVLLAIAVVFLVFPVSAEDGDDVGVPTPPGPKLHETENGIASWYGYPYHGRHAANGEIYDMEKLTAAHRTLPFGTWVRVVNLSNERAVEVRITDRGPFVDGRIIDLSRAAARAVDMVTAGISNVRVEVIGVPKQFVPDLFAVQVGAFQDRGNAERYLALMQSQYGFGRITVREGDPTLWRVLVGSEKTLERAIALASRIRQESAERTAFVARLDR
jgi:rare lipoprotein A